MASWKDGLLPASFRGVAFFYFDAERAGGRRLALHEFPLRDTPYVEDLGRKLRQFRVEAYVLGDDYFATRDALLDALEAEGPGTLVHPYQGPVSVAVLQFRQRETREDGRMALFEIEFVEAGAVASPVSVTDTAGAAIDQSDATIAQIIASFEDSYGLTGSGTAFLQGASTDLLTNFETAVQPLKAWPGVDTVTANQSLETLLDDVGSAASLAADITGFFLAYADASAASYPAPDPTQSSRGVPLAADTSFGLAALAQWGSDFAPVMGATPLRVQQAANQTALVTLVQGAATAALARLYANTAFASAADAESARALIETSIDDLALTAADAGDDAYQDWLSLGQTVSSDLTTRAAQLPDVVEYRFVKSLPSLVLANRFYQDATRGDELVARNDPQHPLFMPLTVEALAF